MSSGDRARVTTFIEVSPATAFSIFTDDIDVWWRRGPRFRQGGVLRFEGGAKGRLVEETAGGVVFEIGRVLDWKPGVHLAFEWRSRTFAANEVTEVDIRFEEAEGGTRMILEHRGWDSIPENHRVRHGLTGGAFSASMGLWWGDLVTSLRAHAKQKST